MAGTEVYTYNLAKALAQRGHELSILYRISNSRLKEYQLVHNRSDGLNLYALNNTFRLCHSFEMTYKNNFITHAVGELLDQIKPDIVHIQHLLFLSTTIIEELKKRNIPVIFTLNDYWLLCQQGQFLNRDFAICECPDEARCIDCLYYILSLKKNVMNIYQAISSKVPYLYTKALKKLYVSCVSQTTFTRDDMAGMIASRTSHIRSQIEKVDLFLAPSDFLRERFLRTGVPAEKIQICRYGLDTERLTGLRRDESNGILRFAFMGTLLPSKGVDILMKAFVKLETDRAELRIYGSMRTYRGYEYYLRYIKKLSDKRTIRFMGSYDNKDVGRILSEIDVVVVPSIWNENSPLIIQEAQGAKVPVVASRIGGIPELAEDNVNGLLFVPKDVDDLAEKLAQFLRDPPLLNRLRNNIKPPKPIHENAKEIERLYSNLLN